MVVQVWELGPIRAFRGWHATCSYIWQHDAIRTPSVDRRRGHRLRRETLKPASGTIRVICQFCRCDIGVKDGQGVTGTSHGICERCLRMNEAEQRAMHRYTVHKERREGPFEEPQTVTLLQQPSKTSCGPTCAAMICNVPVETMLATLQGVRTKARRRLRDHGSNIGELSRLVRPYGLRFGRRLQALKYWPPSTRRALLRVHRSRSRNWHWLLLVEDVVLDPASGAPISVEQFTRVMDNPRLVSFYEVYHLD